MQKAHRNPSIRFRPYLRRHRQPHHLIPRRQHHLVAPDPQRTVEHNRLPIHVVALRILIRLHNHHTPLPVLRHRPSQRHPDVVGPLIGPRHQRILLRLRPAHHRKLQRLARHRIKHALIAGNTPLTNRVIEKLSPRRRRCHLVVDLETRRLRPQQLIPRIFVGLGLRPRRRRQHHSIHRLSPPHHAGRKHKTKHTH